MDGCRSMFLRRAAICKAQLEVGPQVKMSNHGIN